MTFFLIGIIMIIAGLVGGVSAAISFNFYGMLTGYALAFAGGIVCLTHLAEILL